MAPPYPIAATSDAADLRLLDQTCSSADRSLLKELVSPNMYLHRSPLEPCSPTVCVNGYGSLQFVVTTDMDRLLVVTLPRHGNGGITFLAAVAKIAGNPFEHIAPWINFVDNSGVSQNFQQYGGLSRTVITKGTGYSTTDTYVSGLCTGTTVADLRNVEIYNREGLKSATMLHEDYTASTITQSAGIVNVAGPEGMTSIVDQPTSVTQIEQSWYVHSFSDTMDFTTDVATYWLLDWSVSDTLYESVGATDEITTFKTWAPLPTPCINPIVYVDADFDNLDSFTFSTTIAFNVYVFYLYSPDGINTTLTYYVQTHNINPSGRGRSKMMLTPSVYMNSPMDSLSDGPICNVVGVMANYEAVDTPTNASTVTANITVKLGGCREPFDFTSYAMLTLLQQLQKGIAMSIETNVDYVAIPNKVSRNLLTSVRAQNPTENLGESIIDYGKAMQLAICHFDGVGGLRSQTVLEYETLIQSIGSLGEPRTNQVLAEASSGRRIKKFFKNAGKGLYKEVLKPLAHNRTELLNTALKGANVAAKMANMQGAPLGQNLMGAISAGMQMATE